MRSVTERDKNFTFKGKKKQMRYFHGDFKEACFACVWFCYFIFLSSHKTMLGLSQVKSGLTSVQVAYIGYITCVIKTFVTWDCKLNVPILRCKVMIKSFLYAVISYKLSISSYFVTITNY